MPEESVQAKDLTEALQQEATVRLHAQDLKHGQVILPEEEFVEEIIPVKNE
jgi:phytoene/squalene synthetase